MDNRTILGNATMAYMDMNDNIDVSKVIKDAFIKLMDAKDDIIKANKIDIKNNNGFKLDFDFIKDILPQEEKNTRRRCYSTSNNNDIIFFYDDNFSYFYAITAGGGYRKLSNYFDEDFPINMLKKNFWGGFRIAQSRNISWSTYSEEQVFKSFYNFNQVEAFWKIFKKLGGKLNPESSLYRHFQNHNSINAQITEVWIRVSRWLTIIEIVDLIKELENIYMNEALTPEQEILFRFIDSLKRFRTKDKNEKYLKQFFIYKIYPLLNNSELREDEIDLNFCSPNDVSDFFFSR